MLMLFSIWLLWVFYLAVMHLKAVNDKTPLTGFVKWAAYTVLYPGLLIDFVVNMLPITLLFLELPKELLVTSRLSRHIHDEDGWRKKLAIWFCSKLLNPFDPSGCHCK